MERLVGGITNPSNTCYIGSSLEILFRYKPFVDFLNENKNISEIETLSNLASLLSETAEISLDEVYKFLDIEPTKQGDICEFLSKFLDFISKKYGKPEPSDLTKIFMSQIQRKNDVPLDSFIFFTVPVNEGAILSVSIKDLMDGSHFNGESSDLFLVQIQRMIYDKETKTFSKNCGKIEVTEELDLREFGGKMYSLYAVSVHIGSGFAGHYITFIKDSEGWIKINDSDVTEVTEAEFYSAITEIANETPYLLAYVSNRDNILTLRKKVHVEAPLIPTINDDSLFSWNDDDYPQETQKSQENDDDKTYTVYIKEFDPLRWEVSESKHQITKREIIERISTYKEMKKHIQISTDQVQSYDDVPWDAWSQNKPIYIYAQDNSCRQMDIKAFSKKYVEINFVIYQTIFSFSQIFDPRQDTREIYEYAKRILFDEFKMSEQEIYLFCKNSNEKYYVLPLNSHASMFSSGDKELNQVTIAFSNLLPKYQRDISIKFYGRNDTFKESETFVFTYKSGLSIDDIKAQIASKNYLSSYRFYVLLPPLSLEEFEGSIDDLYVTSTNYEIRVQERSTENTFTFVDSERKHIFMRNIKPESSLEEIQEEIRALIPNCTLKFSPDRVSFAAPDDFHPFRDKDGYFVVFTEEKDEKEKN